MLTKGAIRFVALPVARTPQCWDGDPIPACTESSRRVATELRTSGCGAVRTGRRSLDLAEGQLDSCVGLVTFAVQYLGVEAVEHCHAVAGATGDLGGVDAGGEPQRVASVPERVRHLRERRLDLFF